jgi:tRNA A-37 threonylcarbamoyl transferase component Bud32
LATLLDPAALAAMIRRVMPRFDARLDITYVRYKPEQSCLIGYRITDGNDTSFVSATATRPDAAGKQTKPLQHPTKDSPYGLGRLLFPELSIMVSFFPNDEKLPAIERLTTTYDWRRLLKKLFPERTELWSCSWLPIRYKPERRLVGRLMSGNLTQASFKIYTDAAYETAKAGAVAFDAGVTYGRPRVLGQSDRRRILVFEWLPGELLTRRMSAPGFDATSVAEVGRALAELHSQPVKRLVSRPQDTELESLVHTVAWLSHVLPSSEKKAQSLTDRVIRLRPKWPRISKPLHGDFYANQVLLHNDFINLIDFDEAHLGDPACDLGTFIAHLESNAIRGIGAPGLVEPVTRALLTGYRWPSDVSEDRVAWWTAVALLRLAPHAFRNRELAWPETTMAILARVEDLLNQCVPNIRASFDDCAEVALCS